MQNLGKFGVTLSFCAANSSQCCLWDSYHSSHKDFWGAMILTFPQTVYLCFPEPFSISSSKQETPKLQCPSVNQEPQSSENRGMHSSSHHSQLCDQTVDNDDLIKLLHSAIYNFPQMF